MNANTSLATDALGYLAALLVLAAFCMRDMTTLRVLAFASNLAFIAYAASAGLQPVLLLHVVLLPVNLWRLLHDRYGSATGQARKSTQKGTDRAQ
jgi:hypothetical protein